VDDLRAKRAESIYQSALAEGRSVAINLCKERGIPPRKDSVENFAIGYVAGYLAGTESAEQRFAKLKKEIKA
jgi:hypothetical protein